METLEQFYECFSQYVDFVQEEKFMVLESLFQSSFVSSFKVFLVYQALVVFLAFRFYLEKSLESSDLFFTSILQTVNSLMAQYRQDIELSH